MQNDSIQEIQKRTQRYWYEDGIWEIGFGIANILLGGFYLLVSSINWEGPQAILLVIVQMVVILGIFLLLGRFVNFLKERITYPRTGFVAYQRPKGKKRAQRIVMTAVFAAGIAVLVAAVSSIQTSVNQMPLVAGIIMAGMLVYLGQRFGLGRFYIAAVLTVAWGAVVSRLTITDTLSTALYFGGYGLLISLSGLVTLLIYLHRTSSAAGEDDDGSI